MADLDRVIGGLRCRDVLASLSEYVDGELAGSELAALVAHVQGCDQCARFGARFALVLQVLRESAATDHDAARRARLQARLARDLTG